MKPLIVGVTACFPNSSRFLAKNDGWWRQRNDRRHCSQLLQLRQCEQSILDENPAGGSRLIDNFRVC
jgi:hypothetical protein